MLSYVLFRLLALWLLYIVYLVVYQLCISPLRRYPGPKLYAIFRFPLEWKFVRGLYPRRLAELHEQYGEVVRVAVNELSFINPEAWKEIYGHGAGGLHAHSKDAVFQKYKKAYITPPEGVDDILTTVDTKKHADMRKLISHAFSDRALREQESLLKGHVDLLIARLKERAGQTVDMVQWYNYTTFDLIGDLAFGDTFGCLQNSSYHPWVAMIFDGIRAIALVAALNMYIPAVTLLSKLPLEDMRKRRDHQRMVVEKVAARLEQKTRRPDFMQFILRNSERDGINLPELQQNANLLILAGSETTATALSGATYHLLRTPETMAKLVKEIRGRFTDPSQLNTESLAKCTYLSLVLQEALRMYPPVPVGLPRIVTEDGVTVAGYPVPKDTVVSVASLAAYHSPLNFAHPSSFIPERWSTPDHPEYPRPSIFANDRRDAHEPFSIGPRNCIGKNLAWLEMRLILASVLLHFDLTLVDNQWDPRNQEVYILWQKPALRLTLTLTSSMAVKPL